ncbi:MAG: CHASE2 domain-containing protein [Ignavibacteria bacterium]|nr:CHASE2 domain-containing protein [Ignavibacteria bacterium]
MAKIEKSLRDRIIKAGVAFFIGVVVIIASQEYLVTIGPLKELEQKHIDERFLSRGALNIRDTAQVIIIEQTQNTYDGIPYRWPWPRTIYAKAIENLNKAGVKAIGIDIIMANPDQYNRQNDTLLLNTIRKYHNVVVAGKIDNTEANLSLTTMNNGSEVAIQSVGYTMTKKHEDYSNIFYNADSSIGIVEVVPDNDGVIRRYMPMRYSPSTSATVPTFSYAILNKYFGYSAMNTVSKKPYFFGFGGINIPKFDSVSVLIDYYGPSRTFKHIDLLDVIDDKDFKTKEEQELGEDINTWDDPANGLLYSGLFKGKIALIGPTMPEDKDIMAISFAQGIQKGDNLMNGVEIHANAIQNILSQNFIVREPKWLEFLLVFGLVFLTFYISSILKEIKLRYSFLLELANLLIIVGLFIGLRNLSFLMFNKYNILFQLTSGYMSVLLSYIGATAFHFITERKQKGMIKGMFSQYVNATIVDELIFDPEKLQLGGQRKNLTIFFSDIAGFSTFSENKEPEDLIGFLNEYLSEMTRIVFENKGTLDKYIGDAIMAFWGAPVPIEDHAYYGCKSALEMQRRLKLLQEKWRAEGQPEISSRMGLNTGDVVVGNVGGKQRFDYTVMGDAVNLASRLEGANKQYSTLIMISESTYELVKDKFQTRELDLLTVKGKYKPVQVYELLALSGEELSAELTETLKHYNLGLEFYKQQKFTEAKEAFSRALSISPADGPSKTYTGRCDLLIQNPPPPDWDGVFHMTTK